MSLLRRAACGAVALTVVLLAGCSDGDTPPGPTSSPVTASAPAVSDAPDASATPGVSATPGTSASPGASGTPDAASTPTTEPSGPPSPRNDLATAPARHTITASGLSASATYSPRLPVKDWTASVNKPLALSLTVRGSKSGQKIYLTRVTVTITARDETGPLDSPKPLTDTANISPGFIVTSPYTYGQDFVIPALDEGATSVTLDFTYEFLLQVSKNSRDYYKQTAIDSLVVPIPS